MTDTATDPTKELKQAHRAMWALGDYASVAELIDDAARDHLFDAMPMSAGDRLLNVATGTGNAALHAARRGAEVTGLDLVPQLLEVAARRARQETLRVEWIVGDAEALPLPDGQFDYVMSVFGVQFAPRHAVTASELARVCRSGGTSGLVNWTPEGLIGRLFAIMARFMPAAPPFASPPPLWGSEHHLRALFGDVGEIDFARAATPFRFESVEAYMAFFEERYGPTRLAREKLTVEARGRAAVPSCASSTRRSTRRQTGRCTSRASSSSCESSSPECPTPSTP
jgi:SAM-dependent methyltransferase